MTKSVKSISLFISVASISHTRIPFYERLADDHDLSVTVSVDSSSMVYPPIHSGPYPFRVILSPLIRVPTRKRIKHKFVEDFPCAVPVGLIFNLVRCRPDVVLSLEMGPRTLVCLLYKYVFSRKLIIWTEQTLQYIRYLSNLQHLVRRFIVPRADAICAHVSEVESYLIHNGARKARIFYWPEAIDNEFFNEHSKRADRDNIREKLGTELSHMVFLYVGQLILRKGILHLLESWKLLPADVHEETKLWLIGGGPDEKMLCNIIHRTRLRNVQLLGTIPPKDLPAYYGAADVFVLPTLEDTWGLVVNEAMACGLPVLCSKWAGASQLVRHGENGYIFDPLEHNATAHIIKTIYCQRNCLKGMGAVSLEIIKDYTYEEMYNAFKQAIDYVSRN